MIFRVLLFLACAATAAPVSFRAEIAPLLQRRCGTCHSADNPKGHYTIDTFARLMKPGQSDLAAVVPGKPADSELAALLREKSPDDRMPQKADPLPEDEIGLIERWISEGAHFDGASPNQPLVELARASMLRSAPRKYAKPVPITALAFSPDGARLAASGYCEVTIWRVSDGALLTGVGGLPERITSLAWHPRLPEIVAGGGSPMQWGTVAVADPTGVGLVRFLCDLPEVVLSVAISPDGNGIAAGCGDRTVRLFDAVTGASGRVLKLHADWVQTVAFSSDGLRLLTASRDRTARVIDLKSGEVNTSYTGHDMPLLAGAFSRDGQSAWTLARGGMLHHWSSGSSAGKNAIFLSDLVSFIAISDGIVATGTDRKMRLLGETDRKVKATWEAPAEAVQAYAVSPDGKRLAYGTADGRVTIVTLPDGKEVTSFLAIPR